MESLIGVLVAVTVFLLVVGLTMRGERALMDERVAGSDVGAPEALRGSFWSRVVEPFLGRVARYLGRFLPSSALENLRVKLGQAGHPLGLQPLSFVGIQMTSTALFTLAGVWLALSLGLATHVRVIAFILTAAIGYVIPLAVLQRSVRHRHNAIRKHLPDSLDLLVVSSEAGLAFDEAVRRVVLRSSGPLAEEFARVLDDIRLGRSRVEALRLMAARTGHAELSVFVAAIHQAELLGVGIARVLRSQAENLRSRRDLRAREEAAKLPLKLLFPLVFCVFPALFVILLAPAAIQLFKALSGFGR